MGADVGFAIGPSYSDPRTSEILDADSDRRMAVMMPCTIAVYETAKGTRVAALNAALMGPVFGGDVGRVMGHAVARDQAAIIASAVGAPIIP